MSGKVANFSTFFHVNLTLLWRAQSSPARPLSAWNDATAKNSNGLFPNSHFLYEILSLFAHIVHFLRTDITLVLFMPTKKTEKRPKGRGLPSIFVEFSGLLFSRASLFTTLKKHWADSKHCACTVLAAWVHFCMARKKNTFKKELGKTALE